MPQTYFARALATVSALLLAPLLALAQTAAPAGLTNTAVASSPATSAWPTKPIRIVVPFGAGSFTDIAARTVGIELSAKLGQPIIVETKGGAGSTLGTDLVAKAAPDGYTFLVTDNSFAVSSALYEKLPYSPKDLVQVSLLADAPAVLVGRPGLAAKTLQEVVELARSKPGTLTFGSGGQGSSAQLAMEAFLLQNKLQLVHIPFKGIAPALMEVAADRVDIAISSVGTASPYIKDGRLLGLAVSSEKRHPNMPNVPTFTEAGFSNYKMMYWFGMMAPAGTPPTILERMQKEIVKAVATPKVIEVFAATGVRAIATSPATFTKMVQSETTLWSEVITRAKIQPE
ncbi:MAG: tripartite tricarboxylate transporter substrate binding protein [Alcaligenaceae bacterium]